MLDATMRKTSLTLDVTALEGAKELELEINIPAVAEMALIKDVAELSTQKVAH